MLEKKYLRTLVIISLTVLVNLVSYLTMTQMGGTQSQSSTTSNAPLCRTCIPLGISPDQQINVLSDLESLSFWVVTGAALIDSINPCAIVTLLFLSAILLASEGRRKVLEVSAAFIFSSYVVYLLLGLGLIVLIDVSGLSFFFRRLVASLSMIIGLEHLRYGDNSLVEIPSSWRSRLVRLIRGITGIRTAFLAGFVVTLLELPCTGGPYMVVLGLLAEKTGGELGTLVPILLYYNFIFVLPLMIISLLVYFGTRPRFKEKNIEPLHSVTGLAMILMGIYLLIV